MSIGNLFLGTARKTIGDVVMYRRNGVQQARVRVRSIANPKTEGQALQRNYMAPVTKFYAPLAGVLERSWEGLNRSESLSAFLKANFQLAREKGWYVIKGAEFTALPYQVSKGILAPMEYTNSTLSLISTPTDIQVSSISAILVSQGYEIGDQVTFVGILRAAEGEDMRPVWSRFLLSESNTTEIFADINDVVSFQAAEDSLEIAGVADDLIACAFIVSRWDGSKWLRSTQFVKCDEDYLQTFTSPEARAAAIASYQNGAGVVNSDIYLNGGSGSAESADSGLIVEYCNSSTKEHAGYCKLVSVLEATGYHVLEVKIVDIASETQRTANVMLIREGATYDGRVLAGSGNVSWRAEAPTQPISIRYIDNTTSAKLRQWLRDNGVRGI